MKNEITPNKFVINDFYNGAEWNAIIDKYYEEKGMYVIPVIDMKASFDLFAEEGNYAIFFDKNHWQFCLVEACVWSCDTNEALDYSMLFIGRIAGGYDAHLSTATDITLKMKMVEDNCCYSDCNNIIEALQFLNKFISDEDSKFWERN